MFVNDCKYLDLTILMYFHFITSIHMPEIVTLKIDDYNIGFDLVNVINYEYLSITMVI